jgi:hypothetical protein
MIFLFSFSWRASRLPRPNIPDQGIAGAAGVGFPLAKSATDPLGRFIRAARAMKSLAPGIEPAPAKLAAREHIEPAAALPFPRASRPSSACQRARKS